MAELAPKLNGLGLTMLPAFVKEAEELAPKLKMPGVAIVEVLPAFAGEVEELPPTLNMPGVAEVLTALVEEDEELPPKLNILGVVLLEMVTAFVEEAEELPLKVNIPGVALLEIEGPLVFEGGAAELAPKVNVAVPFVGPVELPAALEADELAPKVNIPEAALLEPTMSLFEGEAETWPIVPGAEPNTPVDGNEADELKGAGMLPEKAEMPDPPTEVCALTSDSPPVLETEP